jgi:hypothetical protein
VNFIFTNRRQDMGNTRIGSGRTTPGNTNWQPYNVGTGGIYIDVDTSAAGFSGIPVYVSSIGGTSNHWATTGGSAIYAATATGFRVYVRYADGGAITPAIANQFSWHINWIGMDS